MPRKTKNTKKQKKEQSKTETVRIAAGNYPVGDFLVRLKNAGLARMKTVEMPHTKLIKAVAKTLVAEGYLADISEKRGKVSVTLTYRRKEPILTEIKLVSKPGLRVYIKASELEKRKDPSILLISTPSGVMSSKDALKKRLGGEVIAEVL